MTATQSMSDEAAIQRVVYRFYQSLNERDWVTMHSLAHKDFVVVMQEDSSTVEDAPRMSREDFIDAAARLSSHARETQHLLGSLIIDVDGPSAHVSLMQYGVHIFHLADGRRQRGDSGGICRFQMTKTEAGWVIASMQFKTYFTDPGYLQLLTSLGWPKFDN